MKALNKFELNWLEERLIRKHPSIKRRAEELTDKDILACIDLLNSIECKSMHMWRSCPSCEGVHLEEDSP